MLLSSDYKAPTLLPNGHAETIIPSLFRKVEDLPAYTWERMPTPDADFLDLGWLKQGSNKLIILSHGLEGDANRHYIRGMAKVFYEHGFDALAWNYRGCGEEMNQQPRFYHSGATDDLHLVVQHALQQGYSEITLCGFSMGGNISLKYAGEQGSGIDKAIKQVVAFSVPLNLHTSCIKLSTGFNKVYSYRFLKTLKQKVVQKEQLMPGTFDLSPMARIQDLTSFDDHYTAPLHGFADAVDYYTQCGAIRFVENIQVRTLLVNALNDPFLSPECFPYEMLRTHPFVHFETPQRGGHVGFSASQHPKGYIWSELRALAFCTQGQ
ncbi:alpha/beta fold hydrolase [Cytophagales bacterium LB-30]|uniref:Alpha/beta fold hydrolase n=1 Tax=Shiella aurantiaca TaxID=3058365 RepID=A0ABT8F6I1_9BACT|nr:alpha/beta fold hydrolase [Shiella aurantiaca]MDN4166065.1 alpha/beta fold hydrolase [Shiella aurantiaca]